jgi:putative nucleotidyltransferase with HDIG domain
MLNGKLLLLDRNLTFIDILKESEALLKDYPLLIQKKPDEIYPLIKSHLSKIRLVFVSAHMTEKDSIDIVEELKKIRPTLSIVIIKHNDSSHLSDDEYLAAGCNSVLRAPEQYSDLVEETKKIFRNQDRWTDIKISPEEKNIEFTAPEKDYFAVPVSDFVLSQKSFFNVFIKLAENKFIKILDAGETIDDTFIEKYFNNKIEVFYIKKEEQQHFINLCKNLCDQVIKRSMGQEDIQITKILDLGNSIASSLYKLGITEKKLDYADSFLGHTFSMAKRFRMTNSKLKNYLDLLAQDEHVAAVTFISGMLAVELGIESSKSVKMVGMAALFHDIGLFHELPDIKEHELDPNNSTHIKVLNDHGRIGANILRENGGFEAVIMQSIEQHHLRKRGNSGGKINNLTIVAEIIGCADDFYNRVLMSNDKVNALKLFEKNELQTFSPNLEKAFLKIVLGRKNVA